MRIAIDASRTTVSRRTGTENYALQLTRQLLQLKSDHHFDLYFRDTPAPNLFSDTDNYTAHVIPFERMWTHVRFAAELWRNRPAVTWVPAHTLPRFFPGKSVVTVHDLGYIHFPYAHPEKERRYLDWSTRHSANRATLIMADSIATQRDLTAVYGISAEKVRVVYPGVDENLHPVSDPQKLAAIRQKYGLPPHYLIFIGTLQPRKNIERLVEAFAQWRAESGQNGVALALAGSTGWLYEPEWSEGVDGVKRLGYVDDADISALYSGAIGLVFPSLYEGFGFPVVEAMRCEIPVLCSNTSSLPELAGEAAILVDPLNIDAISQGINQLVEDAVLRKNLIERGKIQVQKFTWEAAAKAALQVLEEAAS